MQAQDAGTQDPFLTLAIYLCYSLAWPNKNPASVLTTMLVAGWQLPEQIALFVCVFQAAIELISLHCFAQI